MSRAEELFMIMMMVIIIGMRMFVMVAVRTGRRFDPSAARLAVMTAATFPEYDPSPEIAA